MKKQRFNAATALIALCAALSVAAPSTADAAPAKKVAAKKPVKAGKTSNVPAEPAFAVVNGKRIPRSVADAFIKEQLAQGIPDTPELRKMVREELVRREVVAQAATAKGLDKRADLAAQVELSKQALLIRAYVQDYLKANPTTDEMLKAEYEKSQSRMKESEFKARHILVDTEDEAKAIIAKLVAGEKFETLAVQSKDPGSKDSGGDLGWSASTAYVKPFADALAALEKGKYTTAPIKTEFGFHVIQLEDTRTAEPPAFEHIKEQLSQHTQRQKIEKLISDLQAKAKIE